MRPGPSLLVVACALLAGVGAARADDSLVLDLGGTTLETRRIVHGSFTQGASAAEPIHDRDEEPAHPVTIAHDFWMGKFPVTRGQFAKFAADTRYVTDAEKGQSGGSGWDGKALVHKKEFTWKNPGFTQTDEHPVVLVTYGDALAFTGWASRKTGKRVRLPSEAEWEFAARAGTTTPWYGGGTDSESAATGWFKANAGNGTRPVGQKKANPNGLFDMSGNVYEWCRDIYGAYHDAAVVDPELTMNVGGEPERRVLRGGSWLRDVKRARSGARHRNAPGSRNADNGFRVVVTNEEVVSPGVIGATSDFAPANPIGTFGAMAAGVGSAGGPSMGATAGPLADGDPVRLSPVATSSEGFSWALVLVSPLASSSAVVAWMLLRRKRSSTPSAVSPSGNSTRVTRVTRVTEDGFFMRVPNAPPGSRARYECAVNGKELTDVVPLAGDETFVYTGSPPTSVRILEVLAASPGTRAPHRPPAPAMIDPGLMPPSSRPRPPPVPRRSTSPSSFAQPVASPAHIATTHRESANPIAVPLPMDRTSTVGPTASSDTSSVEDGSGSEASSLEDALVSDLSLEEDRSASETSSLDAPSSQRPAGDASAINASPSAASTSEAFLGNPRAY